MENGLAPVPITLMAVFTLVAFISAGLLFATDGVQTAQAQSAECDTAITDAIGADVMCDVVGDSTVVNFENTGTAASAYVYVRDGRISDGTTAKLNGPELDEMNIQYILR